MICQKIIEQLERHSPLSCAVEWDNVGLLSGRRDKEVHKVLVALDATKEVIACAVREQADLLVTHHPLIFGGMKSVSDDDIVGSRLLQLIRNDISYYAMHTNFDVRGMADLSAQKMELQNVQVLEVTRTDGQGSEEGIGRVGELTRPMTLKELAEYVKHQFELPFVRVCGEQDMLVTRAAVSGGSGKSMVRPAIEAHAQVLISGDLDYHTVLDAGMEGLAIIDAGHFGTEKMFVPYIKKYLEETCSELIVQTQEGTDPFYIV